MVSCLLSQQGIQPMPEGFWPMVVIVAVVVVYAIAKVMRNMQKSEEQWRQVDKSKLREWKDDDEWRDDA
jgi:hypothetical protein